MPDQNGTGNQNGGGVPVNPFQTKPSHGGGNGASHGGNNGSKSELPKEVAKDGHLKGVQKSEAPKVEHKVVPKDEDKVAPINPFAPVGDKKTDVIEGEVVTKKPERRGNPYEEPKPFVHSDAPEKGKTEDNDKEKKVDTSKVKVSESSKVQEVPKSKEVPVAQPPKVVQVEDKEDDPISEFREQMMDILDQAGITKGTLIKTGLVVAAAVVVILGYVYGWYGMIAGKFDRGERVEIQEQETGGAKVEIPIAPEKSNAAYGVVSAYIFGLEFNRPVTQIQVVPMTTWGSDAGVRAASILGMTLDQRKVKFVEYVTLLRKLQNIYDTDVYALLDMSVDRRAALQQHINELVYLLDSAGIAYNELEAQLVLFDQQYEPIIKAKDAYETNFFNSLYAYYGESAYVNLGMFVERSQDAMEMKAYFNSYKTLRELFVAYINALRSRYSDISVNTEALIKGVRVFYVPNSDIRTIIKLGE